MIILLLILIIMIIMINNYEHFTNTKQNKLNVMVSHSHVIITLDNYVIVDTVSSNLICVILRNGLILLIAPVDVTNVDNILNMIKQNDTIIIAKMRPTNFIVKAILVKFGAKIGLLREDDNYLLIRTAFINPTFEMASKEPIYYPRTTIIKKECRVDPQSILHPKVYTFYKYYYFDDVDRCSIETLNSNKTRFGLTNGKCVPMSDDEYKNQYVKMPTSSRCVDGNGIDNNMMAYQIAIDYNDGIVFYDSINGGGNKLLLGEGVYDYDEYNKFIIKSIRIPPDYYLFLLLSKDIAPYYGPATVNVTQFETTFGNIVKNMIIQKHRVNNVRICGKYNNNTICLTFGQGINVLFPGLFLTVTYVLIDNNVDSVTLYGDTAAIDLVTIIRKINGVTKYNVEYPRIIRSVKVEW